MNTVCLIGRLTKDPELKFGQSGVAYCRFNIAVQRDKDNVDFINCSSFKKTAELIGEHFKKGNQIGITGRLQMNRYEKDGQSYTTYEVIVNSITFIGNKDSKVNNNDTPNDDEFPF